MLYSDFVTEMAGLMILLETITDASSPSPSADPNFNAILPRGIEYAEQRMYRELDLIQTTTVEVGVTAASNRYISIPAGYIVLNALNVITPPGANPDDVGASRNPLLRLHMDTLNALWPQSTLSDVTGIPRWYANQDNSTVLLAPAPSGVYTVEFIGTMYPQPLSATNNSTILTTYLPQVFSACAMVFFSGYQRDYGAQSDDPKMALSWETQYQTLKAAAVVEIARIKSQADLWAPFSKTDAATSIRRGQ